MIRKEPWYREASLESDLTSLHREYLEGKIDPAAYLKRFLRVHPIQKFPADILWEALQQNEGQDLKGYELDLRGRVFSSLDLSNLHLAGHNFEDARFIRSTLVGTSFEGCNLQYTVFNQAVMMHTRFDGANLQDAKMKMCNLRQCSFEGAKVDGLNVIGSVYYDTTFQGTVGEPTYPFRA